MKTTLLSLTFVLIVSASRAQGFHWEIVPGPGNARISAMEVSPNGDLYMYSEGDNWVNPFLFKRSNGIWSTISMPADSAFISQTSGHVREITFGKKALILTIDSTVYRLDDGGWKKLLKKNDNRSIVRTMDGSLLRLTGKATGLISSDEGETWTQIAKPVRHDSVYVNSIAEGNGQFFAAADSGLYQLQDSIWTRIYSGWYSKSWGSSIVWTTPNGCVWYLCNDYKDLGYGNEVHYDLFFSSNNGKSWARRVQYLNFSPPLRPTPVDKDNTTLALSGWYSGIGKGTFFSAKGDTLGSITLNQPPTLATRDSAGNWYLYANYCSGNYRQLWTTNKYSGDWTEVSDFPGSSQIDKLWSLPFCLIASDRWCSDYISTDHGDHWKRIPWGHFDSIIVTAAGTVGKTLLGITTLRLAVSSTNGGTTWTVIDSNNDFTSAVALHDTVYVATGTHYYLYRSVDKGITWQRLNAGNRLFGILDSIGNIYAFNTNLGLQIYFTTDFGVSWSSMQMFHYNNAFVPSFYFGATRDKASFWNSPDRSVELTDTLHSQTSPASAWETVHIEPMFFSSYGMLLSSNGDWFSGGPYGVSILPANSVTPIMYTGLTNVYGITQDVATGSVFAYSRNGSMWRSVGDPRTAAVERPIRPSNIRAYPNPATTLLSLSAGDVQSIQAVTLLGITVDAPWKADEDGATIDISSLKPGPYYLIVHCGFESKPQTLQIIKE